MEASDGGWFIMGGSVTAPTNMILAKGSGGGYIDEVMSGPFRQNAAPIVPKKEELKVHKFGAGNWRCLGCGQWKPSLEKRVTTDYANQYLISVRHYSHYNNNGCNAKWLTAPFFPALQNIERFKTRDD
jgi:hypothetical protein